MKIVIMPHWSNQLSLGSFLHSMFFHLFIFINSISEASLVSQLVKSPLAMWETWVRFQDWEDPPQKGKATHSSLLT